MPTYIENVIREERKTLSHLSGQDRDRKIALIAKLQNTSWQDWWEIKMEKNTELVKAIKNHQIDKVKDLLNENKYMDMIADVNY